LYRCKLSLLKPPGNAVPRDARSDARDADIELVRELAAGRFRFWN